MCNGKVTEGKQTDSLDVIQVRLVPERKLYSDTPIRTVEDAVRVIGDEIKTLDRETVAVLALNMQKQILSASFCSVGTLDGSLVSPREIFKSCILQNAAAFIMFHNHPSGPSAVKKKYCLPNGDVYYSRLTPSEEDVSVTKRMAACGELLGIPMLDHIIIAGYSGESFSFQESGMMTQRELDKYLMKYHVVMTEDSCEI